MDGILFRQHKLTETQTETLHESIYIKLLNTRSILVGASGEVALDSDCDGR